MPCIHCAEQSNSKTVFTKNLENIILEIDQLVEQGIYDIHTADSEFNIPLNYYKEVLRRIIKRNYNPKIKFWGYCQVKPFDEEFADLLYQANFKGINFGTDHIDEKMLKMLRKWYTKEDIVNATNLCKKYGIKVMHELLFGAPGETKEKIFKTIDFMRTLDPWVTGITVGIALLPHTTLTNYIKSKNIIKGIYYKGEPFVDPTFFVDPSLSIPGIFEEIKEYISYDSYRMMSPTIQSNNTLDNQLINSERLKKQLKEGKKGAYWYWYRKK